MHALMKWKEQFTQELDRFVKLQYSHDEKLNESCAYALLGAGKRTRPLLVGASAQILGANTDKAILPALAIELVHTYSLVHDDLPCIDNDDFRRGQPTVHKVYGEAMAVLVGDSLLTDAFRLLADVHFFPILARPDPMKAFKIISELAQASGSGGMILGQTMDIASIQDMTPCQLEQMHLLKTGKLMAASMASGAIVAGVNEKIQSDFRELGQLIGLGFQIQDDLLDSTACLGKTPGIDQKLGKSTFSTILTSAQAQNRLEEIFVLIYQKLSAYAPNGSDLETFLRQLQRRSDCGTIP